jgi:hypothetical protein
MRRVARWVSVLLVICMAWTPVSLQAMMIGTDQVVSTSEEQGSRDRVMRFVQRGDVAAELESFGISSAMAQERVTALTPGEIDQLAGNIDSLPAGADTTLSFSATSWLVAAVILLIVFFIWLKRA